MSLVIEGDKFIEIISSSYYSVESNKKRGYPIMMTHQVLEVSLCKRDISGDSDNLLLRGD